MEQIIAKSQKELDAVPVDYNGRIVIGFGTPFNRAVVDRRFMFPVVARENSSVVAWENSSVVASGNSQIVDATYTHDVRTTGNARVVYNPRNIGEYLDYHGIERNGDTVKLYKAVHKRDGRYVSDWDNSFEYVVGEVAKANFLDTNVSCDCGYGIHMAHKEWCVDYGRECPDLAVLEVESEVSGIIVPTNAPDKVRAASVKVLREVPLNECGLLGKILAKKF